MNLSMTADLAAAYSSGSQRARVVTESWAEQNLYCPNCSSATLSRQTHNTRAFDFRCPICRFDFQLKGQKTPFRSSITDGAYGAMMDAIWNNETPNFYFLHYEILASPSPLRSGGEGGGEEAQSKSSPSPPQSGGEGWGEVEQLKTPLSSSLPAQSRGEREKWVVRNLLLIPSFAFPPSAIIKRPPLSATARRAGWVGCNFDLRRIPADARIEIVRTVTSPSPPPSGGEGWGEVEQSSMVGLRCSAAQTSGRSGNSALPVKARGESVVIPPAEVREKFRRVKPLSELPVKTRGWTLDVLNVVQRLITDRGSATRSTPARNQPNCGSQSRAPWEFTNEDIYAFERELQALHPDNRHIRPKIRQQLQVLRDLRLLIHAGNGRWRIP